MSTLDQIASEIHKTAHRTAVQAETDPAAVALQLRDLLQRLIDVAPRHDLLAEDLLKDVRSLVTSLYAEVMGIKSERLAHPDMVAHLNVLWEALCALPSVYDI